MPLPNSIASATITLYRISEVSIYKSDLISSNGTIFHPYDLETTLSFTIFKESQDITSEFYDIVWTRYSYDSDQFLEDIGWGEQYKGSRNITIHKNDFQEKCVIQVDAYTVLDGKRTCVASSRITLIDINELYSSEIPPENPRDGQMWVDTSSETPIIYSWNDASKRWVSVGKTVPVVRNLIRNSNFWKLNSDYFQIENDLCLRNLVTTNTFEKIWLRLKSNKITDGQSITAGIYQTTTYPIVKNSNYTLSFLAYRLNDVEYTGERIYVKAFSINDLGESSEIGTYLLPVNTSYGRIDCTFCTLNDTASIKVIIGVEPMKMCDFYITEISLYNTDTSYPWELAPEDLQEQIDNKLENDQMSVFNALTKNGTMEGIFMNVDEEGNEHYYFNASHIKTGSLDGGLINGIGLNIIDDVTGQSIFHVYKDENGTHIDMIAQNLYIGTELASTKQYAEDKANVAESNALDYTDSVVAASRSETEELLNENIASTAQSVTNNMTDYVNNQITDTIAANNAYTNDVVNAAVSNSKNYADEIGSELMENLTEQEKNLQDYIDNQVISLTGTINRKADLSAVEAINGRLIEVEEKTTDDSIINIVLSSDEYIADLNGKLSISDFDTYKTSIENTVVKKESIIAAINDSQETELIELSKIDTSELDNSIDKPKDEFYSKTIYSNNNIRFTPNESEEVTLDTLLENIDFNTSDTDTTIELDVSKIVDTDYVKTSEDNSEVYIDMHEMIKFLLYKVKQLEDQINNQ